MRKFRRSAKAVPVETYRHRRSTAAVSPAVADRWQRSALHVWARRYARWAAAGMFLGANAREHAAGPRAAHYARIDRSMHHGV